MTTMIPEWNNHLKLNNQYVSKRQIRVLIKPYINIFII